MSYAFGGSRRAPGKRGIALGAVVFLAALGGSMGCASNGAPSFGSTSTTTGTGSGSGSGSGSGGSTAASSTASTSGGGGGGNGGCTSSAECMITPETPVCDAKTGACVVCTSVEDVCARGSYCSLADTCVPGCRVSTDCTTNEVCDVTTHACVGCLDDSGCPDGSICAVAQVCIPGCSATQACPGQETCCSSSCTELATDVLNCGECSTTCPSPPNTIPMCSGGVCGTTCASGYADCDGNAADGCEVNTLSNGPCVCVPGATQPCYTGAPGTQGVGLCKGGTQTCDPSGMLWDACLGEVTPSPVQCDGLDHACDGVPSPPGCTPCTAGTGTCNGEISTYCPNGLGNVVEDCDPLQGMTCNPTTGRCEGGCSVASLGTSYIGCNYFPTVTATLVDPSFDFAVAISNTTANAATVTVTQGTTTIDTVTVAPNDVQVVTLPWVTALKGPASIVVQPFAASVRVNQGAYQVRSTQPVTVYQFSPIEFELNGKYSYTNDASLLLPTNAWTGSYMVASRHHFAGASGFYAVTAWQDNTTVTVNPPPGGVMVKPGITGIDTTGTGQLVLNAGDVIEVVTNGSDSNSDPNDLTGSLVTASNPVQVIGGHQCTYIPDNVGYCDHLEESMFPRETLSTSYYVTAPLNPLNGTAPTAEMVRIIATTAGTTLTYDPPQAGAPTSIAQPGQWIELTSDVGDFHVTSNVPVLVAQYMQGNGSAGDSGGPTMLLAVPDAQYLTNYLVLASTTFTSSYANLMAPTGANILVDGTPAVGFTPIGASGYSVARTSLSNAGAGNHTLTSDQPFGVSVYGYAEFTAYWMPGGANLVKLHQ